MITAPPILFDSMIVIEAVRTCCWNAITGQRIGLMVEECAEELRRGDVEVSGYVPVADRDLERISILAVTPGQRAEFRLRYPEADGLDAGERDLLAHALVRTDEFEICCCDKAAVVAMHALGLLGRIVSLESVARTVGGRPTPGLRTQFTESRMQSCRTSLTLGSLM